MKLIYKSYIAKVTFYVVTRCFHGEVINIKDCLGKKPVVVFLSSQKWLLQAAFKQAIEQYVLKVGELEVVEELEII